MDIDVERASVGLKHEAKHAQKVRRRRRRNSSSLLQSEDRL